MFYELKHSLSADYCKVESGEDFSFPAHMHHCFEWIMVTEGVMTVEVGEESYMLSAGESVLIFPNQIHGYCTTNMLFLKPSSCRMFRRTSSESYR